MQKRVRKSFGVAWFLVKSSCNERKSMSFECPLLIFPDFLQLKSIVRTCGTQIMQVRLLVLSVVHLTLLLDCRDLRSGDGTRTFFAFRFVVLSLACCEAKQSTHKKCQRGCEARCRNIKTKEVASQTNSPKFIRRGDKRGRQSSSLVAQDALFQVAPVGGQVPDRADGKGASRTRLDESDDCWLAV